MEFLKVIFDVIRNSLLNPEKDSMGHITEEAKIRTSLIIFGLAVAALAVLSLIFSTPTLGILALVALAYYAGTKQLSQQDLVDWANKKFGNKESGE